MGTAAPRADGGELRLAGRGGARRLTAARAPEIDGYPISERLAEQTGQGSVYRAWGQRENRWVALKVFDRGDDPDYASRLIQEVLAVQRVHARGRQPNVVQLLADGKNCWPPYIVMEYYPDGSLQRRLVGPLNVMEAARLVGRVAHALEQIHGQGLVHRDIKPANILLVPQPGQQNPRLDPDSNQTYDVVLADFGCVGQIASSGQLTMRGSWVGTLQYMSPEQASLTAAKPTPQIDVYAAGVVLYQALTGRTPFAVPGDPEETRRLIREEEPVSPRRLQPSCPRDLETICLKCLHKEPHRRYASASLLASDLGRFLRNEPIEARPVGHLERAVRWARRNRFASLLIALVLLSLLGTTILAWLANREASNARTAEGRTQVQWLRAERERAEKTKQWKSARAAAMNAQLLRVASFFEREPIKARELLHDTEACPLDLRDSAWNFYELRMPPLGTLRSRGEFRVI